MDKRKRYRNQPPVDEARREAAEVRTPEVEDVVKALREARKQRLGGPRPQLGYLSMPII